VKGNAGESLVKKRLERKEARTNHVSIKKQLNLLVDNLARLGVKEEDLPQFKAKTESLKESDRKLETHIKHLDRDIQRLESQQIDKKELRGVFQDFAALYADAPPESKCRMLNVIIEEFSWSVKRGEKTGEITYKLRGDGTVKKNWEDAVVATK